MLLDTGRIISSAELCSNGFLRLNGNSGNYLRPVVMMRIDLWSLSCIRSLAGFVTGEDMSINEPGLVNKSSPFNLSEPRSISTTLF